MYKILRRAGDLFLEALMVVCMTFMGVMTLTVFAMVVSRYCIGFVFSWSEELTLLLMVWLSLLGAVVVLRRREHIRLGFFFDRLPRSLQAGINILFSLLSTSYLLVLSKYSFHTAMNNLDVRSPTLGLPLFFAYGAVMVSSGLMVLFSLLNLFDDVKGLLSPKGA